MSADHQLRIMYKCSPHSRSEDDLQDVKSLAHKPDVTFIRRMPSQLDPLPYICHVREGIEFGKEAIDDEKLGRVCGVSIKIHSVDANECLAEPLNVVAIYGQQTYEHFPKLATVSPQPSLVILDHDDKKELDGDHVKGVGYKCLTKQILKGGRLVEYFYSKASGWKQPIPEFVICDVSIPFALTDSYVFVRAPIQCTDVVCLRGKPLPDNTRKVFAWWAAQFFAIMFCRLLQFGFGPYPKLSRTRAKAGLMESSRGGLTGLQDTPPNGRKDGNVVRLSTQVKSGEKSLEASLNEAIAG